MVTLQYYLENSKELVILPIYELQKGLYTFTNVKFISREDTIYFHICNVGYDRFSKYRCIVSVIGNYSVVKTQLKVLSKYKTLYDLTMKRNHGTLFVIRVVDDSIYSTVFCDNKQAIDVLLYGGEENAVPDQC